MTKLIVILPIFVSEVHLTWMTFDLYFFLPCVNLFINGQIFLRNTANDL